MLPLLATKRLRSSEAPGGVGWPATAEPFPWSAAGPTADWVRRLFVRYDADLGMDGCWPLWKDGRRLTSGDPGADEAGDRGLGGV